MAAVSSCTAMAAGIAPPQRAGWHQGPGRLEGSRLKLYAGAFIAIAASPLLPRPGLFNSLPRTLSTRDDDLLMPLFYGSGIQLCTEGCQHTIAL